MGRSTQVVIENNNLWWGPGGTVGWLEKALASGRPFPPPFYHSISSSLPPFPSYRLWGCLISLNYISKCQLRWTEQLICNYGLDPQFPGRKQNKASRDSLALLFSFSEGQARKAIGATWKTMMQPRSVWLLHSTLVVKIFWCQSCGWIYLHYTLSQESLVLWASKPSLEFWERVVATLTKWETY